MTTTVFWLENASKSSKHDLWNHYVWFSCSLCQVTTTVEAIVLIFQVATEQVYREHWTRVYICMYYHCHYALLPIAGIQYVPLISFDESLKRSVTDTVGRCMRRAKHVFCIYLSLHLCCVCVVFCVRVWTDKPRKILRGTWFEVSSEKWYPLEELDSILVEKEHCRMSWRNRVCHGTWGMLIL